MDLFLLHTLILAWASIGAARRLTRGLADQLLAAGLLAWGNLVVTSLFLSVLHQLGEPRWFLSTSTLLAVLVCLLVILLPDGNSDELPATPIAEAKPHPWLLAAFLLTLLPLACATVAVACTYEPNNPEALTYHLPRALYYLGQGSLAHFDAADLRQTYLPFNYNLLQAFVFIYGPPLQCLNLFNVLAWALGGIAVYRLCRVCAFGANASLLTSWLVLVAPPVIAQAATTTPDLPAGVTLLCVFVYALRWKQTRQTRDAMLSGLALGLSAGSDWGVLFWVLVAGGFSLAWCYPGGRIPGLPDRRAWIIPALLAGALSLPFALINLAAKGPRISQVLGTFFRSPDANAASGFWIGFLPLVSKSSSLPALNEDVVGFGLLGLLFLVCAAYGAKPPRKSPVGLAWLGIGGIISAFLLHRGSFPSPRNFIPAGLLLSPGVATVIVACQASRRAVRYTVNVALLAMALATAWSAGNYLLHNTRRPAAPLLSAGFVPPALPTLPLVFAYNLSTQSRVNIDTDGVNEAIFPFLALGHYQRFTFQGQVDPEVCNLILRSGLARNAAYHNQDQLSSCVMLAIPTKRTAGVEFLATLGKGAAARDYYVFGPPTSRTAPNDNNRCLLLTLTHEPWQEGRPMMTQLNLAGLNREDRVRIDVVLQYDDGSKNQVATLTTNGKTTFLITRPFHHLLFRAIELATGEEVGSAAISYDTALTGNAAHASFIQPASADAIFVTDAVLEPNPSVITCEGLLPTEGPFPQWNIPFIRWARQPLVTFRIPPIYQLARLQIAFSVRLYVREKGDLLVVFNGRVVHRYHLDEKLKWLDQSLDLIPQPGENVLEFKDATFQTKPDWLDYLQRYPDVKDYLVAQKIPLERGASDHYLNKGKSEGRTVKLRPTEELEPAYESYYFMYRNIRLEGLKSP